MMGVSERSGIASVAGLTEGDNWREVFAPYSHIVLVANSASVDIAGLVRQYPSSALFVFFNKVYKILEEPFQGNALLVTRAQPKGSNIVYRGEVAEVLAFFEKASFLGIMNIRLGLEEKLNSAADFNNAPTARLDLLHLCQDFYTADKLPTSGFAMALWLTDLRLSASIVLAGFSGKRSEKWRLVSVHDWNLEQTFLRLFCRTGKIVIHDGLDHNPFEKLARRFPDIPADELALTASEVLSERLANTNAEVDKLISLTNIIKAADNFLRRLKPSAFKKRT